jgi:hypothetical protein
MFNNSLDFIKKFFLNLVWTFYLGLFLKDLYLQKQKQKALSRLSFSIFQNSIKEIPMECIHVKWHRLIIRFFTELNYTGGKTNPTINI